MPMRSWGRGWSFPPELTDSGIKMSAYEQDIEESLRILFSTSPGERVNRYDYGCPLRRYAFEPITTETITKMRNDITQPSSSSSHASRWKMCRLRNRLTRDCC